MRKHVLLLVAPALLILVLLLSGFVAATHKAAAPLVQAQAPSSQAAAPLVQAQAPSSQAAPGDLPGVPAIKPSMPGKVPAFAAANVHAYIHAHPFPGTSQVIDDSKITSIQFIPSSQAVALMKGEPTGIADNETVCYVEFANINATLDLVSSPSGAAPPVIHTGQIVYNAATGNLLVWGGL